MAPQILRHRILAMVLVIVLGLGSAFITLADTTDTLLPTADGGDDSADWANTGSSACNGADCYTEVDESTCDDDTSYIESSTNAATQTFDIDESSITDGATITQIDITVCNIRVENGAKIQARYCVDGSCSSSGTNITPDASYSSSTQSFTGLSIIKSSGTDLEIGVASTAAKGVRVSGVSTVITFTTSDLTAPADVSDLAAANPTTSTIDLSWTAPGDDGSTGTATTYGLRYATENISSGNWASATSASGEPTPSVAGSSEALTISSLTPNTTYYFGLKTSDEVPNESNLSNVVNDLTLAAAPASAAETSITTTSITANWTVNSNPTGTEFYAENTTASTNSGWVADAISFVSSTLSVNTAYTFQVKARNSASTETSATALGTTYTLANAPAAAAFGTVTETSIIADWTANSNPSGTEYYVENETAGTNSGWITNTTWTSSSLTTGTSYTFRVRARNGDSTNTTWVDLSSTSTTTIATPTPTPTATTTVTSDIPSATGPTIATPVIDADPSAAQIGAPGTTTAETGTGETVTEVGILPTPGDVTPPVMTIVDPPQVVEDTKVIFSGTAREEGEPRGVVAGLSYSFDDGLSWHPMTTVVGLGTPEATFTVTTPALPDGTYTIKVRGRDNTANEGLTGDPVVTIDLLPVIFGSAVLLHPSGEAFSSTSPTVVAGSMFRAIAAFEGGATEVTISLDGKHFPLLPDTIRRRWSAEIRAPMSGTHTIRLRARDGAGHTFDQDIGRLRTVPALRIVDAASGAGVASAEVSLQRFDAAAAIWRTDTMPRQDNPLTTLSDGSVLLAAGPGQFRLRVGGDGYWSGVTELFNLSESTTLSGIIKLPRRPWYQYLIPSRTRPIPLLAQNLVAASAPIVAIADTPSDLTFTDLSGAERELTEFQGHRVLLTTVAGWNRTSHDQLAVLNRLQEAVGDDVYVIPWLIQQPASVLAGILERGQYNLLGMVDVTGQDLAPLTPQLFPSHYFFDRRGVLRQTRTGFASLDELIDTLSEVP